MATARPLLWGWRRSFRREIGFFGLLGKHVGTAHEASGQDTTLFCFASDVPQASPRLVKLSDLLSGGACKESTFTIKSLPSPQRGGQWLMPPKRAMPPNRKERRTAKFALRPKRRTPVEPMPVPPTNIKRLLFLVALKWRIKLRYARQRWLWPKAANRARQTSEEALAPGDWVLFCLAGAMTIALNSSPTATLSQ
jgi:hypothetical protein